MALCFDDVLLQPQYSEIESRSEVDISPQVSLNKLSVPLRSPIVASPMDTVTNAIVAKTLIENGGFAVLHRYNTIDRQLYEFNQVMNDNVCCAIPATGDYLRRAWELHDAGCNIFCIDVAHGHHILVKNALKALRSEFGVEIHLMTGNVSTLEAFNDLSDWGASSVRIGVGGGCIPANTLIKMKDGRNKTIENIVVGDNVMTHVGTSERVLETFSKKHIDDVVTFNDKITLTLNHEVLVLHKQFNDIVTDENIMSFAEWKPAGDITPDDYSVIELLS